MSKTESVKENKKSKINSLFYNIARNYKTDLMISFSILFVVLAFLGYSYYSNGYLLEKGIDFQGGSQYIISINGSVNIGDFKNYVSKYEDVKVKYLENDNTIIVESKQEIDKNEIVSYFEDKGIYVSGISVQRIGAALGKEFWKQGIKALIIAYIIIASVIFFLFKTLVPSIAALLASVSDILTAVALMNLFNIPLTLSSLAGLLILIGYSIDTDILLSTRVLKKKDDDIDSRIVSSIKTGLTMSITSIASVTTLYVVASIPDLQQIALVIIFGLLADIPYTWLQNVGILKWYINKKGR